MKVIKNIIVKGKHGKPIVTDVFFKEDKRPKNLLIFCHGYKGFKDWGAWNLMATAFSNLGFFFVKFNFSHNGGSIEQPIDFPDLEAFGNNNYTKERDDLQSVIDWVVTSSDFKNEVNCADISLMGHSRGGGTVLIKAAEDRRITKVISLAGVSDYGSRFPKKEDFKKWVETGVFYVKNGRTKQEMPHFYQFYEDFKLNEKQLNIQRSTRNLKIPQLIIHGDSDASVSIKEAALLQLWNPKSTFKVIQKADHVFNVSHPWQKETMSQELEEVINTAVCFLKGES
jgi:pimeloyl-ACP methyl ester carboxylesterase